MAAAAVESTVAVEEEREEDTDEEDEGGVEEDEEEDEEDDQRGMDDGTESVLGGEAVCEPPLALLLLHLPTRTIPCLHHRRRVVCLSQMYSFHVLIVQRMIVVSNVKLNRVNRHARQVEPSSRQRRAQWRARR